MPVVEIEDPDDARLDDYRRLSDPVERREIERSGSFFIAEGDLVIRALVAARDRWPIRSVLATRARYEALAPVVGDIDAPVYVAPLELLRTVAGFNVHRGALASADRGAPLTPDDVTRDARLLVVLEAVNDIENVGSIFRGAAAFGADGVLLDPRSSDPLYRRSLRVSLGHALRVPFARADAWPGVLGMLRDQGFCVLALTPSGDAEPIDDVASHPPERAALLVGSEGHGLSAAALDAADRRVQIPIVAGVDSLNVAVAASIALHRLAPRIL